MVQVKKIFVKKSNVLNLSPTIKVSGMQSEGHQICAAKVGGLEEGEDLEAGMGTR